MSNRIILKSTTAVVAVFVSALTCGTQRALADNPDSMHATAIQSGDGVVTVGAGLATSQPAAHTAQGGSGSGVTCTDVPLDPSGTLLNPGGPGPGMWVLPYCVNGGYVNPQPPTWVSTARRAPRVAPITVARDAMAQLTLPSGSIQMAPNTQQDQLVGARTWLWVDPTMWRSFTATAAVGPVAATATAQPVKVVWNMGDGNLVTCFGPGTPYDPSRPDSGQSTYCSYVWPSSSAGQPSDTFTVSATVYWSVSWTARGAPGGGNLGMIPSPRSQVAVQVAEAQSVNSSG